VSSSSSPAPSEERAPSGDTAPEGAVEKSDHESETGSDIALLSTAKDEHRGGPEEETEEEEEEEEYEEGEESEEEQSSEAYNEDGESEVANEEEGADDSEDVGDGELVATGELEMATLRGAKKAHSKARAQSKKELVDRVKAKALEMVRQKQKVEDHDDDDEDDDYMTIVVATGDKQVSESIEVRRSDTVRELLGWIDIDPGLEGQLFFNKIELPGAATLEDCGIEHDDRVLLKLRPNESFSGLCGTWERQMRRSVAGACAERDEVLELSQDGSASYVKAERSDDGDGNTEENKVIGAGMWNVRCGEVEVFCAVESKYISNDHNEPVQSGNFRLQLPLQEFKQTYSKRS